MFFIVNCVAKKNNLSINEYSFWGMNVAQANLLSQMASIAVVIDR